MSFKPIFEKPINKEFEFTGSCPQDVRNKLGIRGKKNIGHYFVHLVASIYGGYASGELFNYTSDLGNGYMRNFNPDIAKETNLGTDFTEVKSVSHRTSCFNFKKCQVENYLTAVLNAYETNLGEKAPSWNIALARYGKHELLGTHLLQDKELVKTLSHSPIEIVNLSSNLFLGLLLMSDIHTNNQFSSRRPRYESGWKFSGGTFSKLAEGCNPGELFDVERFNAISLDDFLIDKVKVKKRSSEEIGDFFAQLGRSRFKLKPFTMIDYSLSKKDTKEWFDFIYDNHELICEDLDIEDGIDRIWHPEKYIESEFNEVWGDDEEKEVIVPLSVRKKEDEVPF